MTTVVGILVLVVHKTWTQISLCTSNLGIACKLVEEFSFEAMAWDFVSDGVDEYRAFIAQSRQWFQI